MGAEPLVPAPTAALGWLWALSHSTPAVLAGQGVGSGAGPAVSMHGWSVEVPLILPVLCGYQGFGARR